MLAASSPGESALPRKALRITYIVHHYPPDYRAGAEQYTHRAARWMVEQGHDVEVVTLESISEGSSAHVESTLEAYEGVPVHRLRFKLVGAPHELTWRFDNPLLEQWVADYLTERKPDFVHFMAGYLIGIGPLRAVRAAQIPMALTMHDYWFVCPRHTLQRGNGELCTAVPETPAACARCEAQGQSRTAKADSITGGLYSAVLARFGLAAESAAIAQRRAATAEAITWPDVVIAPTRFLAAKVKENLPRANVLVVPHGNDALPEQANDHAVAATVRAQGVQIGYLGQIAQHKGVHVLVEAFRKLDPGTATLHIHGVLESNPDYSVRLRKQVDNAPNIHFHGGYNRDALPAVLASLDAVVVPSVWYENSPLVIMEALGEGVPVITSRLGGMAELVEDGRTGLHFTMGDADALADTLRTFTGDAALRERLRANARNNGRYAVADEMRRLEAIYLTHVTAREQATAGNAGREAADVVQPAAEVLNAHRN